jgi:DNA-binding transcriptional LysR family regulator
MLEELRRFILVANNGNLTKTSEQIFITQSALTQSIQRLEKNLGKKLFMHKGKTLHLTPEGTAIVEIGTKILELWSNAKNPQITKTKQPTYSIGLFDGAALKLGKLFLQNNKNKLFNLEMTINSSNRLLFQLQLGILDVAVCVIDKRHSYSSDIILIQTFTENLIPVSSKQIKGNIKNLPYILYNKDSNTRTQIDEVFAKNNVVPNVFAESTSITFMKELAILGSGIALLPENYIQTDIKQGILKKQKMRFKWQREFGIFINKHGQLQKESTIIKDLIKNLNY